MNGFLFVVDEYKKVYKVPLDAPLQGELLRITIPTTFDNIACSPSLNTIFVASQQYTSPQAIYRIPIANTSATAPVLTNVGTVTWLGWDENLKRLLYISTSNAYVRQLIIQPIATSPTDIQPLAAVGASQMKSSAYYDSATQRLFLESLDGLYSIRMSSSPSVSTLYETGVHRGLSDGGLCFDSVVDVVYSIRYGWIHQIPLVGNKFRSKGPVLGMNYTSTTTTNTQAFLVCDPVGRRMWVVDLPTRTIWFTPMPAAKQELTNRAQLALGSYTRPSLGFYGMSWGDSTKTWIYAVDPNLKRVAKIHTTTPSLTTWLNTGAFVFSDPRSCVWDPNTNAVYVTDNVLKKIVKIPVTAPTTAAPIDTGVYNWASMWGITIDAVRGNLYATSVG